jgi:hypothetical protein
MGTKKIVKSPFLAGKMDFCELGVWDWDLNFGNGIKHFENGEFSTSVFQLYHIPF